MLKTVAHLGSGMEFRNEFRFDWAEKKRGEFLLDRASGIRTACLLYLQQLPKNVVDWLLLWCNNCGPSSPVVLKNRCTEVHFQI